MSRKIALYRMAGDNRQVTEPECVLLMIIAYYLYMRWLLRSRGQRQLWLYVKGLRCGCLRVHGVVLNTMAWC